ncbi:MAG: HlyC/CorC family transporter [Robiginitomaculum sp.]
MERILETENLFKLGVILLLLVFSAFFSGSETALTAASRARILAKEKEGSKRAGLVGTLLEKRERLIGALLLGNNLVNILASTLMASLMLTLFGETGIVYATVVMTVLILIFAEVLPKTYAITKPENSAMGVARPVRILVLVLAPIVSFVQGLVNFFLKLFGVDTKDVSWSAVDEIKGQVDLHHKEGSVEKNERDQLLGVLSIGDLTVEDVMIHRKNLKMVEAGLPPKEMVNHVLVSGHTRLPVWKDDKDNVIGVLHAKDMLKALSKVDGNMANLNFAKIMRKAWFVPETTPVLTQLRAFQQKHAHFALAVDEYGAIMGVVTLEDILEEIVGDIKDEHDHHVVGAKLREDGSILVNGDVPVRDINRAFEWALPDDEAVTIAGLVIHESQTIPDPGQVFDFYGYRFEIKKRHRNQITKLLVKKFKGHD